MRVSDLGNRHIVVWGFGAEGQAAVRFCNRHANPASVVVVVDGPAPDIRPAEFEDLDVVSVSDAGSILQRADVLVKSPGVSPYHGAFAEAAKSIPVTGGTAMWFAETNGDRTIGVTGSKGKSTTTSLIAHLLAGLGEDVVLAGNVGRAPIDVLDEMLTQRSKAASTTVRQPETRIGSGAESGDEKGPWYALELSSFQSSEVRHSPEVGVLTSLFPEHLDWHESVETYYQDKCNLFAHRPDIRVAVNTSNGEVASRAQRLVGAAPYGLADGIHVGADGSIRDVDGSVLVERIQIPLKGAHNAINLAGALTALRYAGFDLRGRLDEIVAAASSFRPLAYRLQPLGTLRGRDVVDDGLSTAPEAAVAALAAYNDRPVGIIIGGHDRGLDYSTLATALSRRTTPTFVFGVPESGKRIVPLIEDAVAAAANQHVQVLSFEDFDDAVVAADRQTPTGGVILLSPGAPSFGRFKNYADRSARFRSILGISETS